MDLKNMGALVGGLVVSVILLAAVLVPVISEATETEKTFSNANDSIAYYDKVGAEDSITFEWAYTTPTKATINGEVVDLPDPSSFYYGISLISTEGMAVRYYVSGSDYVVQSIGGGQNSAYYGGASVTGQTSLSITITNEAITNNSSNRSYTTTGNTYVISDEGDYVMKGGNVSAYLLGDSNTLATGLTVVSGTWVISGWDSENGVSIEPTIYYPTDTYTLSDVVINSETVNGYEDLSKLTSVQYKVTNNEDSTINQTITYSYFIVPVEVTAELSQHMSSTEIALIDLVPLLVTVGIIVGIVGMAFSRRE